MKVKKVIEFLSQYDPDEEVCVDNVDIHFIERAAAFYDGPLQVLERDETKKYYNITGGKYIRSGYKIRIRPLSIADALSNEDIDKVIVDYSQLGNKALEEKYKESDDKTRAAYKKITLDCEWELFFRWAKEAATKIAGEPLRLDISDSVRKFFDENIDPYKLLTNQKTQDEIDGKCVWDSYNNKRKLEWDSTLEVEFDGFDFHIKRKNK